MSCDSEFDPTTRCVDRLLDDIWKPYSNPEHRIERDLIYGATPKIYAFLCEEEYNRSPHDEYDNNRNLVIPRGRFFDAYDAVCFANAVGHTLTNMVTINWEQLGYVSPDEINEAYIRFTDRLSQYGRRIKEYIFYVTVFERGPKIGCHSHTIFSLPYEMRKEFNEWIHKSISKISINKYEDCMCDVRYDRALNIDAQWFLFKYLFKSIDPRPSRFESRRHPGKTVHDIYGLTVGTQPSLDLDIKPVRICRYIGKDYRKRYNYYPLNDIRLHAKHNYDLYTNAELCRIKSDI